MEEESALESSERADDESNNEKASEESTGEPEGIVDHADKDSDDSDNTQVEEPEVPIEE